ncbi:hypothetical protein AMTRI_Chr05g62650 [Amborella trichopoda]
MYSFSKTIFSDLNPLQSNCPLIKDSCLCNGTKLICKTFHRNTIEAQITIGNTSKQIAFLSRIPMQPSENFFLPVQFKRKQFHFRLAFVMTINKSQGLTNHNIDLYLPKAVFTHGRLYLPRKKKGLLQRHHHSNIPKGEIIV